MNGMKLLGVVIGLLLMIPPGDAQAEDDRIPALFERSFQAEAEKDFRAGLKALREILNADPRNYVATLRAGWLAHCAKDHRNSVAYYRKAVALAPDALEPKLGLLSPLVAAKRWKEAESAARACLRLDPLNHTAKGTFAFSLFSLGKYREAAKQYREVLELYPSDTEMQVGLGWTLFRLGQRDASRKWFARVLSVRPKHSSARKGLAALREAPTVAQASAGSAEDKPSEPAAPPEPRGACCFVNRAYQVSDWCEEGYTELDCLNLPAKGGYYKFVRSCSECRAP